MSGLLVTARPPAARPATCRRCGGTHVVAGDATGFRCPLCAAEWRWAGCGGCGRLSLHDATLESWRCGSCHTANRSWWRTTTARRDEQVVAAHRQDVVRQRHSLRARLHRHRRRLWIVATAAVLLSLAVVLCVAAAPAPRGERTRATCATFAQLRPSMFNGSVGGIEVRRRLQELAEGAEGAEPAVAAAAVAIAGQRELGGPAFERALTVLDDTCAAGRG